MITQNIEYLKNCKEVFVCNICCFSSSDVTESRKHLFNHVLQFNVSKEREHTEKVSSNNTEYVEENKIKGKKENNVEPIKKDWRDDYNGEESSTDTGKLYNILFSVQN